MSEKKISATSESVDKSSTACNSGDKIKKYDHKKSKRNLRSGYRDQHLPIKRNRRHQVVPHTLEGTSSTHVSCTKQKNQGVSNSKDEAETIDDTKGDVTFLPTAVCQSVFRINYEPSSIKFYSLDKAWMHSHYGRHLSLWKKDGENIKSVDVGCIMYAVSGIVMTDDNGVIFSDNDSKCIKMVSDIGKVSTLFSIEGNSKPQGLCRLLSGELAVGIGQTHIKNGFIRIYTDDGKVVKELHSKHIIDPYHLATNKVSGDICVSDSRSSVIILDKNGGHKVSYFGPDDDIGMRFNPYDVCSDSRGHYLITDMAQSYIHILDQNGQFIQFLATKKNGLNNPLAIDVDDHGYAWIGEKDSKEIKIFKYLDEEIVSI